MRQQPATPDAILVGAAQPDPLQFLLLAELLALRTIVLNLNFALATSGPPSAEAMRSLIDRADHDKLNKATERIDKLISAIDSTRPSGIAAKMTILNVHLVPALGTKRLDAITTEQVQRLKSRLTHRSPKTVNNVLTVLNVLLKKAVEWDAIDRLPCTIRLLPIPKPSASFHDFDDYERLVEAARATDARALLIVLLGGEAGLRCGEMMALEWSDVNLRKRQLCVQRSDWKGHVTIPKGGRLRYIPLTARLAASLQAHRHLKSDRVLCQDDGSALTQKIVQDHVRRAARRAQVANAGVHVLRHTFCSHLAMKGAPPRAIQELAGHQDLATTQRYLHLSPAAIDGAIRLLEAPTVHVSRGNMLATGSTEMTNSFQ